MGNNELVMNSGDDVAGGMFPRGVVGDAAGALRPRDARAAGRRARRGGAAPLSRHAAAADLHRYCIP